MQRLYAEAKSAVGCRCQLLCPEVGFSRGAAQGISQERRKLKRWDGGGGTVRPWPDILAIPPERPAPLSHLLLVDVQGVDSGPSGCRLDRRSGWRFS